MENLGGFWGSHRHRGGVQLRIAQHFRRIGLFLIHRNLLEDLGLNIEGDRLVSVAWIGSWVVGCIGSGMPISSVIGPQCPEAKSFWRSKISMPKNFCKKHFEKVSLGRYEYQDGGRHDRRGVSPLSIIGLEISGQLGSDVPRV
jgi:hypothetical protein